MNLKHLIGWAERNREPKKIKMMVRKDDKGNPRESDISVSSKLLSEIKVRALLIEDCQKKVARFDKDITEYLVELKKRGIEYVIDPEPKQEK